LEDWRNSFNHSLTSALDGGEWSASRPGHFTSRERAPGTHWIGGWVGPRAVLDSVVKRKIPSPRRESNPRTPIVEPVAQRYTHWAITALYLLIVCCLIQGITSPLRLGTAKLALPSEFLFTHCSYNHFCVSRVIIKAL
jgi:hypothetical protein